MWSLPFFPVSFFLSYFHTKRKTCLLWLLTGINAPDQSVYTRPRWLSVSVNIFLWSKYLMTQSLIAWWEEYSWRENFLPCVFKCALLTKKCIHVQSQQCHVKVIRKWRQFCFLPCLCSIYYMRQTFHSGASNSVWREGTIKNFQRVPPLLTFLKKFPKGPPFAYVFCKNFKKSYQRGEYWLFLPLDLGKGAWPLAPPPTKCATDLPWFFFCRVYFLFLSGKLISAWFAILNGAGKDIR